MKTPNSFMEAFKQSTTVQDVLVQMGMATDHAWCREQRPEYAARMEELISGGLVRRTTPRAMVEEMKRQRAARGGLFPYSQEESARAKTQELLAAVHRLLPVVCLDSDANDVTIYQAWESVDLLDRAVQAIYELAEAKKVESEEMLRCLRAAQELLKRKRSDD
jgi:hypothetical protein